MCNWGGTGEQVGEGFYPEPDSPRNIDSLINEQHAGNMLSAVERTAIDPTETQDRTGMEQV